MRASHIFVFAATLAGCTGSPTRVIARPPSVSTPVAQPTAPVLGSRIVPPDAAVLLALEPAQLDTGGITSLSLLTARDLIVRVVLPGLEDGVTFITVTLRSVDGTIFYTMRTAFSADPSLVEVDEPGAAHPYDVQHPTGTTVLQLDMYVPIAGTDLVRKSRPGAWQVDARVESTRPFTLSAPVETTIAM